MMQISIMMSMLMPIPVITMQTTTLANGKDHLTLQSKPVMPMQMFQSTVAEMSIFTAPMLHMTSSKIST
jgi:hypothetical protein